MPQTDDGQKSHTISSADKSQAELKKYKLNATLWMCKEPHRYVVLLLFGVGYSLAYEHDEYLL